MLSMTGPSVFGAFHLLQVFTASQAEVSSKPNLLLLEGAGVVSWRQSRAGGLRIRCLPSSLPPVLFLVTPPHTPSTPTPAPLGLLKQYPETCFLCPFVFYPVLIHMSWPLGKRNPLTLVVADFREGVKANAFFTLWLEICM